jgi:hypothetical protein
MLSILRNGPNALTNGVRHPRTITARRALGAAFFLEAFTGAFLAGFWPVFFVSFLPTFFRCFLRCCHD